MMTLLMKRNEGLMQCDGHEAGTRKPIGHVLSSREMRLGLRCFVARVDRRRDAARPYVARWARQWNERRWDDPIFGLRIFGLRDPVFGRSPDCIRQPAGRFRMMGSELRRGHAKRAVPPERILASAKHQLPTQQQTRPPHGFGQARKPLVGKNLYLNR
jgi:hypothetical protein